MFRRGKVRRGTAISTNLPKLLQKGVEINTNIANGILQNLPYLLEAAGNILSHLLSAIMNTYPQVFSAGIDLVLNLANGLINNLPAVITSAISILGQLIATILSHLPQLLESGISLIGQLAAGLIQAIPQVLAAIPQIINSIVSTFKGWNWREIGSNIVSGIANGISSGASAIISAAQSAARAALNAAKRFLGIAEAITAKIVDAFTVTEAEPETDSVWDGIKYFTPDEFKCTCRGRGCNGFPEPMSRTLLVLLDGIREHYGVPVTISSGVRCQLRNSELPGSAYNSRHLQGKAADFAVRGKSANTVLAYVQTLPGVRYAYAIDGSFVHVDVE